MRFFLLLLFSLIVLFSTVCTTRTIEESNIFFDIPVRVSDSHNPISLHIESPTVAQLSQTKQSTIHKSNLPQSITFSYKAPYHNTPHTNYLTNEHDLLFTQPGIHVLIENSVNAPKTSTAAIGALIDEFLGFSFFLHEEKSHLWKEDQVASIRSKNWLQGDQKENNNSVEYVYLFLDDSEHQSISYHRGKNRENDFGLQFTPQPVQSLQRISAEVSREGDSFRLSVREDTLASFHSDVSLSALEGKMNLYHSCEGDCLLSTLEIAEAETKISAETSAPLPRTASLAKYLRLVEGEGFHRTMKTQLEINLPGEPANECLVLLAERFSEDFFIDQYQVDEKYKFGCPTKVILDHTIDLEKPSYQSTPNVVLTEQTVKANKNKLVAEFEIPFHYRYKMPTSDQLYVDGIIPNPSIFVKCNSGEVSH